VFNRSVKSSSGSENPKLSFRHIFGLHLMAKYGLTEPLRLV
jgi:hypothetical protein